MKRLARGFSLAELMVVIAITSILYIEMPDMIGTVEGPKGNRALSDAQMIAQGLWGLNEDSNGFAGDIGFVNGIPANFKPLDNLAFPPPGQQYAPRWNFAGVSGGWNGPYVGFQPNALEKDPWFVPWSFTPDGIIHSNGADTIANTSDDITVPATGSGPLILNTTSASGTIAITVYDPNGVQLVDFGTVQVTVSNPDPNLTPPGAIHPLAGGMLNANAPGGVLTNSGAEFVVKNLQPGQHGIQVWGIGNTNCNGQLFQGTVQALTVAGTTAAANDCAGLAGHAIGFVWPGGYSTVAVHLH